MLPLQPGTKVPFDKKSTPDHPLCGGVNKATRDADVIRGWFDKFPTINFGVRLDDKTAVDVDVRKGDHWADELNILACFDDLPTTLGQRTTSGGFHAIYHGLSPNMHYRSDDTVESAIDIISGRGRYVVGAGFVVDGNAYQLIDAPIADIPFLSFKREHDQREGTSPTNLEAANPDHVREALGYIPVEIIDDRHEWIRLGIALKYEFGDELGRELWNMVSERSFKFDPGDQDQTWRSTTISRARLPRLRRSSGSRARVAGETRNTSSPTSSKT